MEALIHLDTHVVVWMISGDRKRLSPVRERIESNVLVISPIVRMELSFLYEIGRIRLPPDEIVATLVDRVGLRVSNASFDEVVMEASSLSWTRDPFDRLIVANAKIDRKPLLTADQTILQNFPPAVWS